MKGERSESRPAAQMQKERDRRIRHQVCIRRQTRAETRAEEQAEENERCLQDRQKGGRGRGRQARDILVTKLTKKRNTRDRTDIQEIDV